jgi:hypothetical protein
MAKRRRTPEQLAKNASKLHKRIGELLTCDESPLKNYEIRQEVRVSDVNPHFKSNKEKFDWIILGLNVVIEVNGEQHYNPICFGGITMDKAKRNYLAQLDRDEKKMDAALDAGWGYVIIKYTEKNITLQELIDKVASAYWRVPEEPYKKPESKFKIQNRGFQKQKGKYKWPKRKIQSRSFQKKERNE